MVRKILLTMASVLVLASVAACNTVRGVGADLESAADTVDEAI